MDSSHEHFIQLSRAINQILEKNSWFARYGVEIIKMCLRVLGFALSFSLFFINTLWGDILGIIACSLFFYSISITGMHETRHNAFVASPRINKFLGYVFGDFWAGESNVWWFDHHVTDHHVYTNVTNHDEPYFNAPFIPAFVYLFIMPFLVVPFLWYKSVSYLRKTPAKQITFIIISLLGFASQIALLSTITTFPFAILYTYLIRSLFSPVFLHLALFNHISLPWFEQRPSWFPHQNETTRNISPNWMLSLLGGNAFVDRHIEHHLFPTLPNSMLQKIGNTVKEYSQKYNYQYLEERYITCLQFAWKNYKTLFTIVEKK